MFLSCFSLFGFFLGGIVSCGGGELDSGAACLAVRGRLAALISDGENCPYNGNHMYEHIIHLYLKLSQ